MKAVVYKGSGEIVLEDRPIPAILDEKDAVVEVTLTTICSSDIHIKHGVGKIESYARMGQGVPAE